MKVCLIGLGLALLGLFHVVTGGTDEFDDEKNLGTWHVLGLATDCNFILKHKDDMKIIVATLSRTEDGGVKVSTNMPTPQGCQKMDLVFKKREDGKYVHKCDWGNKVVDSLELHGDYAIVTVHMEKKGKETKVVTVYGRERHVTPEVEQKFREAAAAEGLTDEQIKMMPNEVACTEST